MPSFKNTRNKLRTLWENWQQNIEDIQKKDNTEDIVFLQSLAKNEIFKTPFQIYQSDDIKNPF